MVARGEPAPPNAPLADAGALSAERQRIFVLSQAIQAFGEARQDYERLLDVVASSLADVVRDACVFLLVSEDATKLEPVAVHDEDPDVERRIAAVFAAEPLLIHDHPISQRVLETGEPFVVSHLDLERMRKETTPEYFRLISDLGIHSLLVVSLRASGRAIGTLNLLRFRPGRAPFDAHDGEFAQVLANHAALAVSNALLLRRAEAEVEERKMVAEALQKSEELARKVELTRAKDALAKERDVIDRFFTLSLDLLCVAGVDGYFKRLNPAFDTLGWSREELLARPFIDFVHPEDVPSTLAEVEKLAQGIPTIRFLNRYRKKDGTYRWLAWTSAPDPTGTLFAVARDVTDAQLAEEALARAKQEAEVANRDLEAFASSVAHDLRSPLRAIDGFAQALADECGDRVGPAGRRYIGEVQGGARHMGQLIDDLLRLSRVTRAEITRSRVDLSALAHAAVSTLRRREPDRVVDVTIADGLVADGDARLVAILLDNLIANAWKFTSKCADARVEVAAMAGGPPSTFYVRDNGVGFDMRYAAKLFGVFQRLHGHEFEGTGIGLATVERVVRRHGGRVWAKGVVGGGATFWFRLEP